MNVHLGIAAYGLLLAVFATTAAAARTAPTTLHTIQAPSAAMAAKPEFDPAPPVFPPVYEMEWDFIMPYFMVLQPDGFKWVETSFMICLYPLSCLLFAFFV